MLNSVEFTVYQSSDAIYREPLTALLSKWMCVLSGSALIKVGQCEQRLGQTERDFIGSASHCYVQPLRKFLEGEMKTILKERGLLEIRRYCRYKKHLLWSPFWFKIDLSPLTQSVMWFFATFQIVLAFEWALAIHVLFFTERERFKNAMTAYVYVHLSLVLCLSLISDWIWMHARTGCVRHEACRGNRV